MQNGKQHCNGSPAIHIPDDFQGYPVSSFRIAPSVAKCLKSVFIPAGFVQDRIEQLAYDISADMANEPFTALCVLKGGYLFFNELLEKIRQMSRYRTMDEFANRSDEEVTQIRTEFIRLKSYEDEHSSDEIKVIGMESLESLANRNVLIVEDIIDTGKTMVKLLKLLQKYSPKSVRVVSLMLKRTPLSNGYTPNYIGFDVPNSFIVGFNMDYNEYFRDLNHLCVMNDYGIRKYSSAAKSASPVGEEAAK